MENYNIFVFCRLMEEIFWSICRKIFGVPCIQVKDIQSIYTKISLLESLFFYLSELLPVWIFFKFLKVLTSIGLVKHYYEMV